MNLTNLIPPGKTLSKPQTNLLEFISSLGVIAPSTPENRVNPFTGATHFLPPLACALYDFIIQTKAPFSGPLQYKGKKVLIGQWDRARYLFLHLWPDEYYDLID
jgi:hypothetical protein